MIVQLQRPRRLRGSAKLREMVAESQVNLRHLVQGHFVVSGANQEQSIEALPGISRYSVDRLLPQVDRDLTAGIRAVMLFGLPEQKDREGTGALRDDNPLTLAIRALKEEFNADLQVFADVCLCPYTDHGHCGLIDGHHVQNDESVHVLADVAVKLAQAGADWVCPSDMMDGRVSHIRSRLDRSGYEQTAILAYTAKYASAYYGPFREAADSAPAFGDRRTYQMDPRNRREALRELRLDVEEGADVVMVKPALAYLDVVRELSQASEVPVAVYNVSGEYAMVKLAAKAGLAVERDLVLENLHAMRRAGADLIVTYHATQAAREKWLKE